MAISICEFDQQCYLVILNATTHLGAPSGPRQDTTCRMDQEMADFDANIIVKLDNATIKADFDTSVLIPVCETHEGHTNGYDGEGT